MKKTITKPQLIFIHGGMTFKNRKDYLQFLQTRPISIERKIRWSDAYLQERLGKQCEIIRPDMPLGQNARYQDWKIHFERYLPLLHNNVILVGSSLGAIFLAKYLSENTFPKKILSTYLIGAPFDNTLPGEDLVGGFTLKKDLSRLMKQSPNVTLLFSRHDEVIPLGHAKKYAKALPQARVIIYDHIRSHFKIPKFPELVAMIKKDLR